MIWDDFYNRYSAWKESTVNSRISSLEDIGSGEEIVEVCQNIFDPKIREKLIIKSIKLKAKFTYDDVMELDGEISEKLWDELCRYAKIRTNTERKRKSSVGAAIALGASIGIWKGLFGSKRKHK